MLFEIRENLRVTDKKTTWDEHKAEVNLKQPTKIIESLYFFFIINYIYIFI